MDSVFRSDFCTKKPLRLPVFFLSLFLSDFVTPTYMFQKDERPLLGKPAFWNECNACTTFQFFFFVFFIFSYMFSYFFLFSWARFNVWIKILVNMSFWKQLIELLQTRTCVFKQNQLAVGSEYMLWAWRNSISLFITRNSGCRSKYRVDLPLRVWKFLLSTKQFESEGTGSEEVASLAFDYTRNYEQSAVPP